MVGDPIGLYAPCKHMLRIDTFASDGCAAEVSVRAVFRKVYGAIG
jgi:hypothetical protein